MKTGDVGAVDSRRRKQNKVLGGKLEGKGTTGRLT